MTEKRAPSPLHSNIRLSPKLRDDVRAAVLAAGRSSGIVNPVLLGERVRRQNLVDNVALEDIVYAMMTQAQLLGLPVEFDANGDDMVWPRAATGQAELIDGDGAAEQVAAE